MRNALWRTKGTAQKDGFTLIELVVVVVIIGIMASIAIPSYHNTREKAFDREAISSLRIIWGAEKLHYAKLRVYWPTGGGWVTNINDINGNLSLTLNSANWAFEVRGLGGGSQFQARAGKDGRWWTVTEINNVPTCAPAGLCLN